MAPQTNAKCIRGSCVSRATLNLGSDLENGLVNIPATCQKIKMQIHKCILYILMKQEIENKSTMGNLSCTINIKFYVYRGYIEYASEQQNKIQLNLTILQL